jgi:hypothetical protein
MQPRVRRPFLPLEWIGSNGEAQSPVLVPNEHRLDQLASGEVVVTDRGGSYAFDVLGDASAEQQLRSISGITEINAKREPIKQPRQFRRKLLSTPRI